MTASIGDRVLYCVGHEDGDPILRPADVTRIRPSGELDLVVLTAGSYDLRWTIPDSGGTPLLTEAGVGVQPVIGVERGHAVGQWRPL